MIEFFRRSTDEISRLNQRIHLALESQKVVIFLALVFCCSPFYIEDRNLTAILQVMGLLSLVAVFYMFGYIKRRIAECRYNIDLTLHQMKKATLYLAPDEQRIYVRMIGTEFSNRMNFRNQVESFFHLEKNSLPQDLELEDFLEVVNTKVKALADQHTQDFIDRNPVL